MTLLTKIGGRESNSLVTLSEAETYLTALFTETELTSWDALDDDQKEYRLKLAVNVMTYFPLTGDRVYCGQILCFPRTSQGDPRIIPDEAKETQCFIAVSVVHRGLTNRSTPDEEESGERVSRVSVAGL